MITKLGVLALAMETGDGVLNTPTGSDVIFVEDLNVSTSFDNDEPDYYTGSLSKEEDIPGKETITITGKFHLKGSGSTGITTYTEPDWINLVKCAGCNVTQTTGVTTYGELDIRPHPAPNATGTSASALANFNGKRYLGVGCRNNIVFEHEVGRPVKGSFTLEGALQSISDATILTPSGQDTTVAPIWANATTAFTYDGYEALVSRLTLDLQNELNQDETPNATYGVRSYAIVNRDARGEMDAREVTTGTYDWSGKVQGATGGVLTYEIARGGATGTYVKLYAGAVQLTNYDPTDRNGFLVAQTPIKYTRVSGNDEWYIRLK